MLDSSHKMIIIYNLNIIVKNTIWHLNDCKVTHEKKKQNKKHDIVMGLLNEET